MTPLCRAQTANPLLNQLCYGSKAVALSLIGQHDGGYLLAAGDDMDT